MSAIPRGAETLALPSASIKQMAQVNGADADADTADADDVDDIGGIGSVWYAAALARAASTPCQSAGCCCSELAVLAPFGVLYKKRKNINRKTCQFNILDN